MTGSFAISDHYCSYFLKSLVDLRSLFWPTKALISTQNISITALHFKNATLYYFTKRSIDMLKIAAEKRTGRLAGKVPFSFKLQFHPNSSVWFV